MGYCGLVGGWLSGSVTKRGQLIGEVDECESLVAGGGGADGGERVSGVGK